MKLWRADDGHLLRTLAHQKAGVTCVAFNPTDELLASSSDDGTIVVWSLPDGAVRQKHLAWVHSLTFSADGGSLISGNRDICGTIRIWDVTSGAEDSSLRDEDSPVRALALVGSNRLAAAHENGEIRVWSLAKRAQLRKWTAHSGGATALTASRDGRRLVSGGADMKLKVWDLLIDPESAPVVMDAGALPPFFLALTNDNQTVVSVCGDGGVRRFRVSTGESAIPVPANTARAGLDLQRNLLFASNGHNHVDLVDLNSGQTRALITGHAPALAVAWSPDGAALATAHADGAVQLVEAATGRTVRTLVPLGTATLSLAFSPDGKVLAGGRTDGKILVWTVAADAAPHEWAAHGSPIGRIAFSPVGEMLASADFSGAVKCWRVADGAPLADCQGQKGNVAGLAFTPDGQVLASGGSDGTIRLWDLQGNELPALEGPAGPVTDVAIDPLGRWLAAVENTGTLKLWSLVERKVQFAYPRLSDRPTLPNRTVAFSPNGQTLVTAGNDGQLRIYDPRYYDDELPFPQTAIPIGPPAGIIRQAAYSPDGRHIATANGDGTIYILRLAPATGAPE